MAMGITRELLKNKGGLRGRLTERIMLQPFDLSECEEYANAAGLAMSRYVCSTFLKSRAHWAYRA